MAGRGQAPSTSLSAEHNVVKVLKELIPFLTRTLQYHLETGQGNEDRKIQRVKLLLGIISGHTDDILSIFSVTHMRGLIIEIQGMQYKSKIPSDWEPKTEAIPAAQKNERDTDNEWDDPTTSSTSRAESRLAETPSLEATDSGSSSANIINHAVVVRGPDFLSTSVVSTAMPSTSRAVKVTGINTSTPQTVEVVSPPLAPSSPTPPRPPSPSIPLSGSQNGSRMVLRKRPAPKYTGEVNNRKKAQRPTTSSVDDTMTYYQRGDVFAVITPQGQNRHVGATTTLNNIALGRVKMEVVEDNSPIIKVEIPDNGSDESDHEVNVDIQEVDLTEDDEVILKQEPSGN